MVFFGDMWRNDGDDAPEGKIVVKIVGFHLPGEPEQRGLGPQHQAGWARGPGGVRVPGTDFKNFCS